MQKETSKKIRVCPDSAYFCFTTIYLSNLKISSSPIPYFHFPFTLAIKSLCVHCFKITEMTCKYVRDPGFTGTSLRYVPLTSEMG